MFDTDNRGAVTWGELDELFKALGMPILTPELLKDARSPWNPSNTEALDYEGFIQIVESTAFQKLHSFNYNRHGSEYNTRCIKMCISLLARRDPELKVEDLKKARMSFFLYEGESTHGIELDDKTVQAALRLSGRMVAPKKLHVFLMVFRPMLRRRMQFYEFLDLLQYTVRRPDLSDRPNPADKIGVERNEDGVYDLVSSDAFMHPDERLIARLNQKYEAETRQMINKNSEQDEEAQRNQTSSKFPFVAKYKSRLDNQLKASSRVAKKNKELFKTLQKSMTLSKQEVSLARTAKFRPQTAGAGGLGRGSSRGSTPRPGSSASVHTTGGFRPGSALSNGSRPGTAMSGGGGGLSRPSSRYSRHDGVKNLSGPAYPQPPPKKKNNYPATRPRTAPPPRRDVVVSSEQFETRLKRMGELVQAEIDYIPQSSEQDIVIADPNIEFESQMSEEQIIRAQNAVFEPMLLPPHLRKTRPVPFPTPQEYFRDEMFSFKVTDEDVEFTPTRAYAKGKPPVPKHPIFASQSLDHSVEHFTTHRGQMRTDSGVANTSTLTLRRPHDRDQTPFTVKDRATEDPEEVMSQHDRAKLEMTTLPGNSHNQEPDRYINNQAPNEFEKWEDLRSKYSRHRHSEQFYKRAKSAIMMRALERNSPFVQPPRPKSAVLNKMKQQKVAKRDQRRRKKETDEQLAARQAQRLEDVQALIAAHHEIEEYKQQRVAQHGGYPEHDQGAAGSEYSYYSDADLSYSTEEEQEGAYAQSGHHDLAVDTSGYSDVTSPRTAGLGTLQAAGLELSPMSLDQDDDDDDDYLDQYDDRFTGEGMEAGGVDNLHPAAPPEDVLMDYYVTRLMSARGGRTTRDRPQTSAPGGRAGGATGRPVTAPEQPARPGTSMAVVRSAGAGSSATPVPPLRVDLAQRQRVGGETPQPASPAPQPKMVPHKPMSSRSMRSITEKIAAARPQSARQRVMGRRSPGKGQSPAPPSRPKTARNHASTLAQRMTPRSGVRAHHAPARKFELVSKQWAATMFKEKKAKTMLKFAGDAHSFSQASYRPDGMHEDLAPGGREIPPQRMAGSRDIGAKLVEKKANLVETARLMANVQLAVQPGETAFLETGRSLPVA